MNEGEIFKNFNGIFYSQKDITEYIDLGNVSDEKIAEVRTKLGLDEIRKINKGIESQLEEGEKV